MESGKNFLPDFFRFFLKKSIFVPFPLIILGHIGL